MDLYGHRANQLARYFNKRLNERISPHGLYTSQWGIILYLYQRGECTQVELCQYLCVEAPTITRTLSRMEEMGWIIRGEGKDKRQRLISLTDKAYEMFPKWSAESYNLEQEAMQNIDKEELEIFKKVLLQMMKNLE
ncbi:MarR family winged helix-turn-helix transcriptional regulator [Clostridium cylindrosporum]|uniref:Transcriptional regulator, MarR family n=1 Tax=Clostridium cylindrosporum DSM 605 TaxID=1121307 RepID=A0A0J8D7L6_CLOCY|nr:MarR family transcriptional regulator [Clostridium cylindrosporum]KMT22025.1 transcriptional regulator, MarR family [Clostridium cylindrosporum DSM 605]